MEGVKRAVGWGKLCHSDGCVRLGIVMGWRVREATLL